VTYQNERGNSKWKLTNCSAIGSHHGETITCPKQTSSSAHITISTLRVCINERAGYAWMLARHSDWYITANKATEGARGSWTYKQYSMITYALDWASRNRRWRHRCPWFQWCQQTRNKALSKLNQSPGCWQKHKLQQWLTHFDVSSVPWSTSMLQSGHFQGITHSWGDDWAHWTCCSAEICPSELFCPRKHVWMSQS